MSLRETLEGMDWPSNWIFQHQLGLLYLTFAAYTDNELSDEEAMKIKILLGEWPAVENAGAVLEEVYNFWKDLSKEEAVAAFISIANHIGESFGATTDGKGQLGRIYNDLEGIAEADERVCEGEASWLEIIRKMWGL